MDNNSLDAQTMQYSSEYGLYEYVGNGQYKIVEPYDTIFNILFVICLISVTYLVTRKDKSNLQIGLMIVLSIIFIFVIGLKLVCYIF